MQERDIAASKLFVKSLLLIWKSDLVKRLIALSICKLRCAAVYFSD